MEDRWLLLSSQFSVVCEVLWCSLILGEVKWEDSLSIKRWNDKKSQRNFLNGLATKLNIVRPEDWGNVNFATVVKHGGGGLMSRYSGSVLRALQANFPGG